MSQIETHWVIITNAQQKMYFAYFSIVEIMDFLILIYQTSFFKINKYSTKKCWTLIIGMIVTNCMVTF